MPDMKRIPINQFSGFSRFVVCACLLPLGLLACSKEPPPADPVPAEPPPLVFPVTSEGLYRGGALVRGSLARKEIALIFSAHAYADGMDKVRETLAAFGVPGSFFLTGDLYRNPEYREAIARLRADRHFLGGHSDTHICYVDWRNGNRMRFSKPALFTDISNNYREMERFGVRFAEAPYFLPPYEMHSRELAAWCRELGLVLIGITPGSWTFLDYTVPGGRYFSSEAILQGVREQKRRDPHGLSGYVFLVHISTDKARKDKLYDRLDELLMFFKETGYRVVRLHELFR